VRCSLAPDLWPIMGDATQLHQVLLNLAVNSRDAMPDGGKLVIAAENYADTSPREELMTRSIAGPHVLFRISDTGTGIPAHIREKIFEPFFTTKELGKGTGLGLSTTLAIVKAHSGLLELETDEGRGTTFKLYFPAVPAMPHSEELGKSASCIGAGETILLVEDEPSVLLVTKQVLEGSGYRVLTAPDGAAAVAVYAERKNEIAVVFTDMMMPGLDGAATIRALKGINAKVRVLAASGMMTEERMAKASEAGATGFLRKPFTRDAMLEALQQVLAETGNGASKN
jgi:CheY-like chemotaxis protein